MSNSRGTTVPITIPEQSVRTYGFVRALDLAGAPQYTLLDCFVVSTFR